MALTPVFIFR